MSHIPLFSCRYCGQTFETSKGRSSHLSQFKSCHVQLMKASESRQQLKRRRENSQDVGLDADSQNASGNDDNTSDIMDFDPPISPVLRDATPEDGPDSEPPVQKRSKVTVEEIPDVDSPWQSQAEDDVRDNYIEDFPWSAGEPIGKTKRTPFEKIWRSQRKAEEDAWGPFQNEEEWD
jgi:hypothetical protein